MAVPFAAHARQHVVGPEDRPVARGGVEGALVSVVDEAGLRLASFDGHGEGIDGELPVLPVTHGPAHDAARIEIEQHGQMEPTLTGRDEGDVTDPDPVGLIDGEAPFEQVGGRRLAVACGISETEATHAFGHNPVDLAQPGNPVVANHLTLFPQRPVGLDDAIGLARTHMDGLDAGEKVTILQRAPARGPCLPAVVAAARDPKYPAHRCDPVFVSMFHHELVPHDNSFAKYTAAFFKMVFSSARRATSRLRRATSASLPARRP